MLPGNPEAPTFPGIPVGPGNPVSPVRPPVPVFPDGPIKPEDPEVPTTPRGPDVNNIKSNNTEFGRNICVT